MNPCPDKKAISAYLLGKLAEDESEQISRHFEACSSCQTTLNAVAETEDTFVSELKAPPPADEVEEESACIEAVNLIQAMGQSPADEGNAKARSRATPTTPDSIREYKIVKKLGQGGMGAVYEALHTKLDKTVALKVLPADRLNDQEMVTRFNREMKAIGKLKHPNIVGALDAGEWEGHHYLVMDLIDGSDLSDVLALHGSLKIADACELIRQAAEGLQHAHDHGMVHRDLKPSNLMLTTSGEVVILDMGLARLNVHDGELTSTGQIMGTLDYMAPEQGNASSEVDIRADIYSLGATLYKLLAGRAPFAGGGLDSPMKKLMALATTKPEGVSRFRTDVPPKLAELVATLLSKDPKERPTPPQELAKLLTPFADGHDLRALLKPPEIPASSDETAAIAADGMAETTQLPSPTATAELPESTSANEAGPRTQASKKKAPPVTVIVAVAISLFFAIAAGTTFFMRTEDGGTIRFEINDPDIKVSFAGEEVKIEDGANEYRFDAGDHELAVNVGDLAFNTKEFKLGEGDDVRLQVTYLEGELIVARDGKELGREGHSADTNVTPPSTTTENLTQFRLTVRGNSSVNSTATFEDNHLIIVDQVGKKTYYIRVVEMDSEDGQLFAYYSKAVDQYIRWPVSNEGAIQIGQTDGGKVVWRTSRMRIGPMTPDPKSLATVENNSLIWQPTNEQAAFFQAINSLPEEARIKAVETKLKSYCYYSNGENGSDIKFTDDETTVTIVARGLSQIWPLHGVASLKSVDLRGTSATNLSSLKGLPLEHLHVNLAAYNPHADALLASFKTLKTVNGNPKSGYLAQRAAIRKEIDAFPEQANDLSLDEVMKRLTEMLKRLNPDCQEITLVPRVTNHQIEVRLGAGATDLSPIRVLEFPHFEIHADDVVDIMPLSGMNIRQLTWYGQQLANLSGLDSRTLETFRFDRGSSVVDLTPIANLPLRDLSVSRSPVSDLSPLQGMPLERLVLDGCPVEDLSPLADTMINHLSIVATPASDISPLKNLPLTYLDIRQGKAYDHYGWSNWGKPVQPVVDLSPLEGAPLLHLDFDERSEHIDLLRTLPLQAVNGVAAEYFFKRKGMEPPDIPERSNDPKHFLAGIEKYSPASRLQLALTKLRDFTPLELRTEVEYRDRKPVSLAIEHEGTAAVWPLQCLTTLEHLDLSQTTVIDYQQLAKINLKSIETRPVLFNTSADDVLLQKKSLTTVNGVPKREWWDERQQMRNEIKEFSDTAKALSQQDVFNWIKPRLQKLNPDYDVPELTTHGVSPGDLQIYFGGKLLKTWNGDGLIDLSPLRVLPFEELSIGGKRTLQDLSPLRGLPVRKITIGRSPISDLSPLVGMKVKELDLAGTLVEDLEPLRGLPLTSLNLRDTRVNDLSPLAKLPLETLIINDTPVSDLSPLGGTPLTSLDITDTNVTDLSPIRGLKLKSFACLRNEKHQVTRPPIADLSPLAGMPLESLMVDFRLYCDADEKLLRSLPLKRVNSQPVDAFWKTVEEQRAADKLETVKAAKLPVDEQIAKVAKEVQGYPDQTATFEKKDGKVASVIVKGTANINPANLRALLQLPSLTKVVLDSLPRRTDLSPLTKLPNLNTLVVTGRHSKELLARNKVVLEQLPIANPMAGNVDLNVAEWVLGIGGTIMTDAGEINSAKQMPKSPFRITAITMPPRKPLADDQFRLLGQLPGLTELTFFRNPVTDDDLVHLKSAKQLKILRLTGTKVSNAGVQHLSGLPGLEELRLGLTGVESNVLESIKDLKKLKVLSIEMTVFKGDGVEHLAGLKELTELDLYRTEIDNKCLPEIGKLTNLTHLRIGKTNVTDAGMKHLLGLKNLNTLSLGYSDVGEKGLEHLKRLTQLKRLYIDHTPVTDAGLKHIAELAALTEVHLQGTETTAEGIAALRKALPHCDVYADHGSDDSAVQSKGTVVRTDAYMKDNDGFALAFNVGATPPYSHEVLMPTLKDETDALTIEFWTRRDAAHLAPHSWIMGFDLSFYTSGPSDAITYSHRSRIFEDLDGRTATTRWVHFAMVRDVAKKQIRLYVDGKLVGLSAFTQPRGTKTFSICEVARQWGDGKANNYVGWIDETRLSSVARYTGEFTPQRRFEPDKDTIALYHFDSGKGTKLVDFSGNNHHGEIKGAKWVPLSGDAVKKIANAKVDTSNNNSTPIEAWKLVDLDRDCEYKTCRKRDNSLVFHPEAAPEIKWRKADSVNIPIHPTGSYTLTLECRKNNIGSVQVNLPIGDRLANVKFHNNSVVEITNAHHAKLDSALASSGHNGDVTIIPKANFMPLRFDVEFPAYEFPPENELLHGTVRIAVFSAGKELVSWEGPRSYLCHARGTRTPPITLNHTAQWAIFQTPKLTIIDGKLIDVPASKNRKP